MFLSTKVCVIKSRHPVTASGAKDPRKHLYRTAREQDICPGLVITSDVDTSHTCRMLQWPREKFEQFWTGEGKWEKQFWFKSRYEWKYSNMIEQKNCFAYEYLDKLRHFSNGFKVSNYWIMYDSQDFLLINFLGRDPWFYKLDKARPSRVATQIENGLKINILWITEISGILI